MPIAASIDHSFFAYINHYIDIFSPHDLTIKDSFNKIKKIAPLLLCIQVWQCIQENFGLFFGNIPTCDCEDIFSFDSYSQRSSSKRRA